MSTNLRLVIRVPEQPLASHGRVVRPVPGQLAAEELGEGGLVPDVVHVTLAGPGHHVGPDDRGEKDGTPLVKGDVQSLRGKFRGWGAPMI